MTDHVVDVVGAGGANVDEEEMGEEEPLIQMVECRICQDEDQIGKLETPCACSGSLKYAHRQCVQRWCNEKGDTTCEICHQPYQPGYTAPPLPRLEDTVIDISGWTLNGAPLDMNDPRLLAMAEAHRHFIETDYDEYASSNASGRGAAFCRSTALILMALLLFRHALSMTDDGDGDDDASTFFFPFLTPSRWIPLTMLHHGLGLRYLTAQTTKTRGSSFSGLTICLCDSIRAKGCSFHCSSRAACNTSA